MSTSNIDDAILAVAEVYWLKVASIIMKAAQRLGGELPEGDDGYRLIAARIAALVRGGRLVTQGDISKWRHSEVRLPQLWTVAKLWNWRAHCCGLQLLWVIW
jgi:hypothetical protein